MLGGLRGGAGVAGAPAGRGKHRGVTAGGREHSHAGDNGSGRGSLCHQVLLEHLGLTHHQPKKKC